MIAFILGISLFANICLLWEIASLCDELDKEQAESDTLRAKIDKLCNRGHIDESV